MYFFKAHELQIISKAPLESYKIKDRYLCEICLSKALPNFLPIQYFFSYHDPKRFRPAARLATVRTNDETSTFLTSRKFQFFEN